MGGGLSTPVLLIIFNRPHLTRRVFERIREARPARLFIAADGPSADRAGEAQLCSEARSVVDWVDWSCEVNTLFRERNLGCKQAVTSGITWFFEHVECGIILEDDCLPNPSFFPFCAELLERFRNDNGVFMVGGFNALGTWKASQHSYFYTLGDIWGWASWKRAWQYYDPEMAIWTDPSAQDRVAAFGHNAPYPTENIVNGCRAVWQKNVDAWGYQWLFTVMAHGGLGVMPAVNLIDNIGFGSDATHTTSHNSRYADLPVYTMEFPLRHNTDMRVDFEYYRQCHRAATQGPVLVRVKRRLKAHSRRLRHLIHHE